METLSTNSFQPMQPDTGQCGVGVGVGVGSPPPAKTETPKIEITGTAPCCQGPLSPCDVPLSEWESDFSYADNNNCGDYRGGVGAGGGGGGTGGRRTEGGPGKCPSPSRSSPRRHSPVPYSSPNRPRPSRQSVGSSVTSDDLDGGSLSPLRQPHSSSSSSSIGNCQRPCSLPITSTSSSAGSEEFICVSLSDPFCSPTIATTSDAILAITINGDHDGDVEMAPALNDDSGVGLDVSSRTSKDVIEVEDATHSSSRPGVQNTSHTDNTHTDDATRCAGDDVSTAHFQGSTTSTPRRHNQVPMLTGSASPESGENNNLSSSSGTESSPVTCCVTNSTDVTNDVRASRSVAAASGTSSASCAEDDVGTGTMDSSTGDMDVLSESMERDESEPEAACLHAYSSDESSDDDMEDLLPPAALVPAVNCFEEGVTCQSDFIDRMACPCGARHELGSCCNDRHDTPSVCIQSSSDNCCCGSGQSGAANSSDTEKCSVAVTSESNDACKDCVTTPQERSSDRDTRAYCLLASSGSPLRRASYPNVPPSSSGPYGCCSRSACTTAETSPSRSLSHPGRRMTPDDFTLWKVVGHPPLHFPHGLGVLLVHEALPSPYDPQLPTPPIVLTPHTSYDDLHKHLGIPTSSSNNNNDGDGVAWKSLPGERERSVSESQHGDAVTGGADGQLTAKCERTNEGRPDITKSQSFPNLNSLGSSGGVGSFQEPYQAWPYLGPRLNHVGKGEANARATPYRRNSSCGELSSGSGGAAVSETADSLLPWSNDFHVAPRLSDPNPISLTSNDGSISISGSDNGSRSQSLPGSPSNSRAAVIGRLRSMVERRLSSSPDS